MHISYPDGANMMETNKHHIDNKKNLGQKSEKTKKGSVKKLRYLRWREVQIG
jgi:hypothetical protein